MAAVLVIEIRVPLETGNVIEQADLIGMLRAPLKDLLGLAPAGTNHTTRIVNTRADAGKPRKRAPLHAAE